MICNKCNHNLPDDSEFCQYCGEMIEKAVVEPAETVVEEPKKIENPDLDIDKMSPEEAAKYLFAEQLGEECIPPENQHIDTTIKTKYCSRCGSPIDNDTKLCTGCGKQYFKGIRIKFNKFSITVIALALVIVTLLTLCILQFVNTQDLQKDLDYKKTTIRRLEQQVDNLNDEKWENKDKIDFYDRSVVIIGDDGTETYHKYGCSKLDTSNGYWILNSEAADYRGYDKCSRCND